MSTYFLLLNAVRSKDLGVLEDFIKDENNFNHINVNESDEDGVTCLHVAAGLEDNSILECLLDHGAVVNCQTSEGLTPLHIAAMWGRSEQVRSLLAHSADSSIVDANGCNAFMYASNSEEEGSQSCVDIILSHQEYNGPESFDQLSNAESRSTPESSIDFERLNSSPWVTPRRRERKRLREIQEKKQQDLLTDESTLENGHKASSDHEDIEGFLTELSSTDSFSYSTITKLEGSENKSLCSDFLTECSTSDDFDSGLSEVEDGVRRDLCNDGNEGILSVRCLEVTCKDVAEDEDVYETADEDFNGESTRKNIQNRDDDKEDIRREISIVRTINSEKFDKENVLDLEKENKNGNLNDTIRIENGYEKSEEKLPSNEETVIYDWREFSVVERNETMALIPESYKKMSCQELRRKMNDHGQIPGPITPQTKLLYMKKLWRLDHGFGKSKTKETSPCSCYPVETRLVLTGRSEIPDCSALEQDMIKEFNGKKKLPWRGGTEKSSFNYLLLDPRVTLDLCQRIKKMTAMEAFRCFILAIFYVGKGKRSRPYAHLQEAMKYSKSKSNEKIDHIWAIWKAGLGVISLHIFQSAIPVEAFTREACMVEALGLSQLSNQKRGEYYGLCRSLDISKKRKLGIFFLYKAFQIFLQEGERQICQGDI